MMSRALNNSVRSGLNCASNFRQTEICWDDCIATQAAAATGRGIRELFCRLYGP